MSALPSSTLPPLAAVRRLLFTCTPDGNRALIAASLTAHHAAPHVHVAWAHGNVPHVHPFTLVTLEERGVRSDAAPGVPYPATREGCDVLIDLAWPGEETYGTHAPHRARLAWPTACVPGAPLDVFRYARDDVERHVVTLLLHLGLTGPAAPRPAVRGRSARHRPVRGPGF